MERIEAQMRSDFEAVMVGFTGTRQQIKVVIEEVVSGLNSVSARLENLEGRLQKWMFSVQEGLQFQREQHQSIEARVKALEQRATG